MKKIQVNISMRGENYRTINPKSIHKNKTLEEKAYAIANEYKEKLISFGLDSSFSNTPLEIGFFYIKLANKVTIRIFDDKEKYIKSILRFK